MTGELSGAWDRQTPAPGEVFLDHVGWYVEDIEACGRAFERLGFILTPYTEHSHADAAGNRTLSGTANRCAMAERGYLEFLSAVPDLETPLTAQLANGIARYPGLHLIAFSCGDAEAEYARLAADGFALQPLVRLRRLGRMDDGSEATCAFSVIRPAPGEMREGRVQTITQETPDVVWQPSLIARANAITALSGVVVCTDDVDEAAGRFARFTRKALRRTAVGTDLVLDRGTVGFVTPEMLPRLVPGLTPPTTPFIAAVAMRSRDLAATRAHFKESGVIFADPGDGRLVVPPDQAMGAAIVVHETAHPWSGA